MKRGQEETEGFRARLTVRSWFEEAAVKTLRSHDSAALLPLRMPSQLQVGAVNAFLQELTAKFLFSRKKMEMKQAFKVH